VRLDTLLSAGGAEAFFCSWRAWAAAGGAAVALARRGRLGGALRVPSATNDPAQAFPLKRAARLVSRAGPVWGR